MGTDSSNSKKLIYVLECFPSDTLNFVYNEIRVLEEAGFEIEIWSLLPSVFCPEKARPYLERTRNVRPVGPLRLVGSLFHYLLRRPGPLLRLMALPFGNRVNSAGKIIRGYSHLLHGIHFARMIRGKTRPVHAHFAFKAATAALVASRLNGNRFSFTAHGSATVHEPSRYSLRGKIEGASFIVAISEYNRRLILDYCPGTDPAKVLVNRTGILVEDFPYREREPRREGPFQLLCTATLYPIKNHEGLIEAAAVLARRGLDFRLDLVGKGDKGRQAFLEGMARDLGIADRVVFRGLLDHGKIAGLLAEADLFVLTSHSEGIPVSVMEAMATGTPVVAPRVTGLPELIEDGVSGWLADSSSPEAIADAMEAALRDPEARREAARRARRTLEEKYDMVANAGKLAELLGRMP